MSNFEALSYELRNITLYSKNYVPETFIKTFYELFYYPIQQLGNAKFDLNFVPKIIVDNSSSWT